MALSSIEKIKQIISFRNGKKYFLLLALSLGLSCLLQPQAADAARLYYSPVQGSYEVGQNFSVSVYVASDDQTINVFGGTVSFSADILQVASVSKSGSIASLWVQEPSFSNANGTVSFSGLVLNPGFKGVSGKILTINFKAKATGDADLRFSAGEVLANDGQGTNVLQSLSPAKITIMADASGPQAPAGTSPSNEAGTPLAPLISSVTHPDPNNWYNDNAPKFSWEVPAGVTSVRVLYDKYPASVPTVVYKTAIKGKDLSGLADGSYYLHVQFKNAKGWGAISHFRFQIDTTPPEAFVITFPHKGDTNDPRPVVLFNTPDEASGIDHYEVKVGDGQAMRVTPGELVNSNPYVLPVQKPGQHDIIVKAVDKAGNIASASETFTVSALDAPILNDYSKDMKEGDILKVSGRTYPSATVKVFIKDEAGLVVNDKTFSNVMGNFTLIWAKKLTAGTYSLWAQVTDSDGAQSGITEASTFVVREPAFNKLTNIIMNYLSLILLLLFFLIGLIAFAWYGWHKFLLLRKRVKKEVKGVEKNFLYIFNYLQQDIEQQIALIEKAKTKRELTKEEKKAVTVLKRDLTTAKKILGDEIDDITKCIR